MTKILSPRHHETDNMGLQSPGGRVVLRKSSGGLQAPLSSSVLGRENRTSVLQDSETPYGARRAGRYRTLLPAHGCLEASAYVLMSPVVGV